MSDDRGGSTSLPAIARRDGVLGITDDFKLLAVLALGPTVAELEQAAVWAAGDGDVLAKGGRPLAGTVAEIVDILDADEEDERLPFLLSKSVPSR